MSTVKSIKDRFEAITAIVTGIGSFMFDDISKVNTNQSKTWPLLLLKVPETATTDGKGFMKDWTGYELVFYILDTHFQDDTRELAEVWDELREYGEQVIIELKSQPSVYRIKDKLVKWDYGYDLFNDKLVAVKASLTLNAFHCYEAANTPTTDYFRLNENGDYFLLENGDYKLLG